MERRTRQTNDIQYIKPGDQVKFTVEGEEFNFEYVDIGKCAGHPAIIGNNVILLLDENINPFFHKGNAYVYEIKRGERKVYVYAYNNGTIIAAREIGSENCNLYTIPTSSLPEISSTLEWDS